MLGLCKVKSSNELFGISTLYLLANMSSITFMKACPGISGIKLSVINADIATVGGNLMVAPHFIISLTTE